MSPYWSVLVLLYSSNHRPYSPQLWHLSSVWNDISISLLSPYISGPNLIPIPLTPALIGLLKAYKVFIKIYSKIIISCDHLNSRKTKKNISIYIITTNMINYSNGLRKTIPHFFSWNMLQLKSIFLEIVFFFLGMGVVSVDRIYPLTLGSNIGTTFTSILAAMASSSDKLAFALQISFCHLFFNISGILLFYPVPYLRRIPIRLARGLGNTTAEYRWFAIAYLIVCFGCLPILVFGLSLAGWRVFVGVVVPLLSLALLAGLVTLLQHMRPSYLPKCLRTWEWLPECCRSLRPYDRAFGIVCFCKKAVALRRKSTMDRYSISEQPPNVWSCSEDE